MNPSPGDAAERTADDPAALAPALRAEADAADERRLLVLTGAPDATRSLALTCLEAAGIPADDTTVLGPAEIGAAERLDAVHAARLLGQTRAAVVVDAHEAFRPTALAAVAGAVDGGGLLVLLAPPLDDWPDRRDGFDDGLAVPPFERSDVTGHFRRRFVATLRAHRGIAIADADEETVEQSGLTDPAPRCRRVRSAPRPTASEPAFDPIVYEACVTTDQADAVDAFGVLREPDEAVVLTADRGRGKSSAAGIAAGALAAEGADVLVTAPERGQCEPVLARAREVIHRLASDSAEHDGGGDTEGPESADDGDVTSAGEVPSTPGGLQRMDDGGETDAADALQRFETGNPGDSGASEPADETDDEPSRRADTETGGAGGREDGVAVATSAGATSAGGSVRYCTPHAAVDAVETTPPDVLIVDEAAAIPVPTLERTTVAPAVAYVTTTHGYEGTGRGFDVRFRDHLAESSHDVTDVTMTEPIRYAAGDPVETWLYRALLLDARPAVDPLVSDADPDTARYVQLDGETLLGTERDALTDEHLLREAFGLLVLAHYRTEPADLARLLDAPNVDARALLHDGHVVSVALLAREGGLPTDLREDMFEGARVKGNMLPDVLTTQLRDPAAGVPVGRRVLRIATHPAVRSRGLGSHLLERIREEYADAVDWLGVGYGATPRLVDFWADNDFHTVHCSTTRNDATGEYSAIMLRPTSPEGEALAARHGEWFCDRIPGVLTAALDDADPDVVRAILRATAERATLALEPHEWRFLAGIPAGASTMDTAPGPVRELALWHLTGNRSAADRDAAEGPDVLTAREERLLVLAALQARPWDEVADELDFVSTAACMRALGDAVETVLDRESLPDQSSDAPTEGEP